MCVGPVLSGFPNCVPKVVIGTMLLVRCVGWMACEGVEREVGSCRVVEFVWFIGVVVVHPFGDWGLVVLD